MNAAVVQPPPLDATPVEGFSDCHRGLLCGLREFAALPELLAAAERARDVAAATLKLFETGILQHHAEEEDELFDAVLRSAAAGEEREHVRAMVERLTAEHRVVEKLWKTHQPAVRRAAAGQPAQLNAEAVAALIGAYNAHAAFEELEFLPLAARILGRDSNHMAALGLSLHLRHAPSPVGYI